MTGYIRGTVDFGGGPLSNVEHGDIFLAKFDSTGAHMWSAVYGDSGFDEGTSVAFDDSGNTILTGHFWKSADFGGGPHVCTGVFDAFLARFDTAGNHLWSEHYGDAEYQLGKEMAIDPSNNIIAAGGFKGDIDFGGGVMTCTGEEDVYLVKLGNTAVGIHDAPAHAANDLRAHPNPFNPSTTISYTTPAPGPVVLAVYDVQGRLVKTLVNKPQTRVDHTITWDARDSRGQRVGTGVYFLRLKSPRGVSTRKIVLLE